MSGSAVQDDIFLVGEKNEGITGRNLPTNRQVLSVFFYNHTSLKFTIRDSARNAVEKAEAFWNRVGIPVRTLKHTVIQLEELHCEWIKIHKNRGRKNSPAQNLREQEYKARLDELFDIAHGGSEETLTMKQRQYLSGQRSENREGFVPGHVDDAVHISDDDSTTDHIDEFLQKNDEVNNIADSPDLSQTFTECSELSERLSQLSTTSTLKRTVSNFEDEVTAYEAPKPKKRNIMTPALAAALDRTQPSSRNATYILAATASSLGFNLDEVNISRSVIHRHRVKLRMEIAQNVKEHFPASNLLVVHWDGKLLPEIAGHGTVERIPIVVSGVGTEQLLGVPKLTSGIGGSQATAIVETLNDWNLSDRVKAMCFVTTSTNTGRLNGACTLVEQKLQKPLLHLACRHHIFELLLRNVVEINWPTTSGPNVPVFKRFQQHWDKIESTQYETGLQDESVAETLGARRDEILNFVMKQFEVSQPRDDYREVLELACIFLGAEPPRGVKFKTPGAMHHARWLSKALYCLKMFLFRKQFPLKAREAKGLRRICLFIVFFYVESSFTAPVAIKAPNHDFKLMQRLVEYRNFDAGVANAALCKLTGHLWYLSEELAALSLFDNAVPLEVKSKIAQTIRQRESTARIIRPVMNERDFESIASRDVSDFITKKSAFLFDQFELSYEFLQRAPELWEDDECFQKCQTVFKNMSVVNDIAERGVALIQQYNKSITNNEEQKQYLLQVVKSHRQHYPKADKKILKAIPE